MYKTLFSLNHTETSRERQHVTLVTFFFGIAGQNFPLMLRRSTRLHQLQQLCNTDIHGDSSGFSFQKLEHKHLIDDTRCFTHHLADIFQSQNYKSVFTHCFFKKTNKQTKKKPTDVTNPSLLFLDGRRTKSCHFEIGHIKRPSSDQCGS